MKKRWIISSISMVLIMFLVVGCGMASYTNISTKEAKDMLEKDSKNILLDVRTPEEYQQGHAPEALLYPVDTLNERLTELDKDSTYLVICRSGNRSKTASDILINAGFSNVYNVEGGMNDWPYDIVTGQ